MAGDIRSGWESYFQLSDDMDMKWFESADFGGKLRVGEEQRTFECRGQLGSGGKRIDISRVRHHNFVGTDE